MAQEDGISQSYVLRTTLFGHGKDVRACAAAFVPEMSIVTGSRDNTTRIWTQNSDNAGYTESHCLTGPTNFVSSVCCMPPSGQFPQGLILVGSNDCNIYCYNLENSAPLYKLLGHSGTVCSLAAGQFGTLVSGSWDKTARVWFGQKCQMTLEGHQGAVWAVAQLPQQGLMLTGSADKTIRLWRAGKCEKTFSGHEDCVRGIAVLSTREFLSCSNDTTIRHWETTGDCLHVYQAHSSFVYSIVAMEDSDFFVSCGEDRTVRVWATRGDCQQTITLPCASVWCVALLKNGDIVAGGSDGVARIFTRFVELQASPAEVKAFEDEVAKSQLPAQEFGDLKLEDLPTKEVLSQDGKREGQTILVRENNFTAAAYIWSAANRQWSKIGDVISKPDSAPTGGKITFEGKEYDFVFDVNLEAAEGLNLKLPYNLNEDPWVAAQRFIHRYDLSQEFLQQIAEFIMTNTKGMTIGAESRENPDPFTGGGAGSTPMQVDSDESPTDIKKYIPQNSFLRFDIANTNGIFNKLKEFNTQVPPEVIIKNEEDLVDVMKLATADDVSLTDTQIHTLQTLISWPAEFVFPVLDLLRLAIRGSSVNSIVCGGSGTPAAQAASSRMSAILISLLASSAAANQMLSLRVFVNMFSHPPGESLAAKEINKIIKMASTHCAKGNKNTQIALATLFLNYVVSVNNSTDCYSSHAREELVDAIGRTLSQLTDGEAQFRLCVALGTLLDGDRNLCAVAEQLNLNLSLDKLMTVNDPLKVAQCAQQCLFLILDRDATTASNQRSS